MNRSRGFFGRLKKILVIGLILGVLNAWIAHEAKADEHQNPVPAYEWKPMLESGVEYAVDEPAQIVFFKHEWGQTGYVSHFGDNWTLTVLPCSEVKGLCNR